MEGIYFFSKFDMKIVFVMIFFFYFDLFNVVGLIGIVYKDIFFLENKLSFYSLMI